MLAHRHHATIQKVLSMSAVAPSATCSCVCTWLSKQDCWTSSAFWSAAHKFLATSHCHAPPASLFSWSRARFDLQSPGLKKRNEWAAATPGRRTQRAVTALTARPQARASSGGKSRAQRPGASLTAARGDRRRHFGCRSGPCAWRRGRGQSVAASGAGTAPRRIRAGTGRSGGRRCGCPGWVSALPPPPKMNIMDFNMKKLAADAGTFLSRAVQVRPLPRGRAPRPGFAAAALAVGKRARPRAGPWGRSLRPPPVGPARGVGRGSRFRPGPDYRLGAPRAVPGPAGLSRCEGCAAPRAAPCLCAPLRSAGCLAVCLGPGVFPRPVAQQLGSAGGAAQGQRRPRGEGAAGLGSGSWGAMGPFLRLEQNKGVTLWSKPVSSLAALNASCCPIGETWALTWHVQASVCFSVVLFELRCRF